jgi:prevent-host-death family protein
MRAVNIADLKNNFSRYLNEVRRGGEILVRDRRTPIAKIIPLRGAADLDAETRAMVAAKHLAQLVSKDRAERDSRVLGRQRRRAAVHS